MIIVEGEKDSDTMAGLGFTATTCPMGAGKWREHYNEHLKGKRVFILPDNDAMGRKHLEQVAQPLAGAGIEARVVRLPETVKDVFHFVATLDKSEAAEHLAMMIKDADPYAPDEGAEAACTIANLSELCRKILFKREAAGEFDISKMPRVLRDYVAEICKTTAADQIMVLQSVLCAASAVIKKKVSMAEGEFFHGFRFGLCNGRSTGRHKIRAVTVMRGRGRTHGKVHTGAAHSQRLSGPARHGY